MWLECIGVVSRCCCKEVYRFPHNTYPYSTCISSFLQQHPYLIVFLFLFMLCLYNICSKRCSKNIRDRSKIEITRTWWYNYIDKHVDYESRDFHVRGTSDILQKLRADFVYDNGVVEISLLHVWW